MADDWTTWQGVARVRADCEDKAKDEGLAGLELFFRSQALFNERLDASPSYRERQEKWAAKQPKTSNPMRDALEAISAGHNDPRALATEVLARIDCER